MEQRTVLEIIMASSVISAMISGLISLLVSKLQYKNSLKLNRNDKKLELSVALFNELQQSLKKIESDIVSGDNKASNYADSISMAFELTKGRMKVAREVLDQISFLIPKERRNECENEYLSLSNMNAALLTASIKASGETPIYDVSQIEEISPDEFDKALFDYMRKVGTFLDSIKEEIINVLRVLCGT